MNRFVAEKELKNYSVVSIVLLLTHIHYTNLANNEGHVHKRDYQGYQGCKVASITGKKEQGNDYPSLRISESCCHGY